MRFLAQFFSVVFHPLLMPTYAFGLYIAANPYLFAGYEVEATRDVALFGRDVALTLKGFEILKVFTLTAFFPAITIMLMIALRLASDADLTQRHERILPFVAVGFFYIWAYWVYRATFDFVVYQAVLLGAAASIFIALIITALRFKISIHASGAGGLVAIVFLITPLVHMDITWAWMTALLALGLVGSSRLYLGRHTGQEVAAGYALGALTQLFAFLFVVYI